VTNGIGIPVEGIKENKNRNRLIVFLFRLFREKPLGALGASIVLLLLFVGIFADFISPYGMNQPKIRDRLSAPSVKHLLGADNLGRDMLSRVIYGARISVVVGMSSAAMATFLAAVIGTVSGFFGGKFDLIVQRLVDSWLCFPGIVLLLLMITIIGQGMWQIIGVLGVSWGIGSARIIRGEVLKLKENVYVTAARSIGCSNWRILLRHILPNIAPLLIVMYSVQVPELIMAEAGLSFLGLGIPPPAPSWGGMLSGSAIRYMQKAWWMAVFPGLALAITVYGTNMFGDALRDLLDPRQRGGLGRFGGKRARQKLELVED